MAVGLHFLWSYEQKAAPLLQASRILPAGHRVQLATAVPTVVLFAHPHCPCSRASLRQLERILGAFSTKLAVQIFFYHPPSQAATWGDSDL